MYIQGAQKEVCWVFLGRNYVANKSSYIEKQNSGYSREARTNNREMASHVVRQIDGRFLKKIVEWLSRFNKEVEVDRQKTSLVHLFFTLNFSTF